MFRTGLVADIGTMNIKLGVRDGVYIEKNCVAVERGEEFRIAACGSAAEDYRSGTLIRPMREGAAADTNLLALLLKRLARKYTGRKNVSYIEFHAALPRVTQDVKRRSLRQSLRLAGFKEFELHDSLMMGAVGAGLDIRSRAASMLVDIGSETTGAAILCNGGILFESVAITGGRAAERSLQNFFLQKYGLLIGSKTAETIKMNLGKDVFIVDGRSGATGFPESVSAPAEELREAAGGGLYSVFACAADAVKSVQPEAAADLLDNGIILVGGGARQFGLAERMEKMLGLPVRAAENAETAVIDGMRECIFQNRKIYGEIISESAEFASGE